MGRLIDADALIPNEVHTIIRLTATGEQTESVVYAEDIDNAPTVDAVERKRWIPVKTRPMDEEERKYYLEELGWSLDDDEAVMFGSLMPGDGQEVWVCSKCGNVWQDTCVIDEGIGLEENGDWLDIVAWMPFERPEPWKGEANE